MTKKHSPVIGGLENQLLTQPQEVKFCKLCVVSNQRPRIVFDGESVSTFFIVAEQTGMDGLKEL